jgi:translocation and assembly module TamB
MRRLLLIFFPALFLALMALASAALWLLTTESGLQAALHMGTRYLGNLHIEGARGALLGPINIERLRWQSDASDESSEMRLDIQQLQLSWSPQALLHIPPQLVIKQLRADRLALHLPDSDTAATLPADLQLPLAIQIDQLALAELHLDDRLLAQRLTARLHSDGRQHHIAALQAEFLAHGAIAFALSEPAHLDGRAPFALQAKAHITGQLDSHPVTLDVQASGTLEQIRLLAVAQAAANHSKASAVSNMLHGQGEAVLTPFAALPFASARLHFTQLNPAAWLADAPSARLDLSLDLAPQDAAIVGSFNIANQQPGPLDQQRLPLSNLSGQLHWQADRAQLTQLQARLPGGGELTGQADWLTQTQAVQLRLQAKQLDARKIVSVLQSSRLAGPISAELSRTHQNLQIQLRDARMQLLADASLAEQHLNLRQLQLQAGAAALHVHGDMELSAPRRFKLQGELRQFDPAQFIQHAQIPPALLNAQLQASGQLTARPQLQAQFKLRDSQLARQPLRGQGTLALHWPQVNHADIDLRAGNNQLRVLGNYGTADGGIQFKLDAPQLAPYGLAGGLTAQGDLRGTPQRPLLTLQAASAQLGWPQKFHLAGLQLQLNAGTQADDPLDFKLTLNQLDLPDRQAVLRQLQLQGNGRTAAHRLQASGKLAGNTALSLLADGGWSATQQRWQGTLQEARLNSRERNNRNFHLTQPAALQLGAQGWQLGPLTLAGDPLDWRATLQAASVNQQLRAELHATGSRLGQIDAQLQAAMNGPWSLDQNARWQGQLRSDISDLSWLGELIGEDWKSAGRLHAALQLSGTPAQPHGSGRIRGEQLALQLPEQGLQLTQGELAAELQDNLLRIQRFRFASPLQPAPQPLQRSTGKRAAALNALNILTEQPGRLEITGETRLLFDDLPSAQPQAWLEVRLDRLGVWQRSDQWLLLSGQGRLSWQAGTLSARGQLQVDAGYWQLARSGAPQLSDDVSVVRTGAPAAVPPFRPRLDLDIQADLGRNFLFDGAGLNSRLTGALRVTAQGRDMPRASGSIRTEDGRFEAYGQALELERGILRFDGLLDNPGLDIRAVRKGLSVEPGVQVSGTVQKPVVRLISDPALADTEKLAWLVLGHGSEQMSISDATTLLAAAGSLLGNDAGNVTQQLRKSFGVDEIGIRQGSLDGDASQRQAGSRVAGAGNASTISAASDQQIFTVGKRLGANALLSYEQVLGKAESIVKLTVNLSQRLALIGRAGSDNALDLLYTLSFGQPASSAAPAKSTQGSPSSP